MKDQILIYGDNEFSEELIKIRKASSMPNFSIEDAVKEMVFNIARFDNDGKIIKHILNDSDRYPFLINSKDSNGHNIEYYYTHSPKMQEYFFENGLIPSVENNRDNAIINDPQSVHASEITKRTKFFVEELITEFGSNTIEAFNTAENYKNNVQNLFNASFVLT